MTADRPVPRDDRPAPTVFHAGLVVPAELTAELAAALTEYISLLPVARRSGGLSRPVAAVLKGSREAAAEYQARLHAAQAWAAPTPVTPVVLGTAQPPGDSVVEEITTTQAADLAGYSPEWWRRLAFRGSIRARQAERGVWLLQKQDVIAYANRVRQETRSARYRSAYRPGPAQQAC